MAEVTFVVETFLGYDRPGQFVSPEWIDFLLDWFHRFTLRSLLGQTFRDFRILVQCGERHRARLEAYPWDPAVIPCWGNGRAEYEKIGTDFLAVTRIDSDDLFHRDNLAEVKAKMELDYSRRRTLCRKTRIVWDYVNGYVTQDHRRASSPFVTQVFPRSIYSDWDKFSRQHFLPHGAGGLGDLEAKPLRRNRVVVTKHGNNWSVLKRGQAWPVLKTQQDREAHIATLWKKNPGLALFFDRERLIVQVLEPFGVRPEDVP